MKSGQDTRPNVLPRDRDGAAPRGSHIAVTGATGTVGRALLHELAARGLRPRALVRARPGAATAGLADVVEADLERPGELCDALRGAQRLFLLTPLRPDQDVLQMAVVDAARRAGVTHVVKVSALGADPDAAPRILRQHGRAERHLIESGIGYTCLRPNAFMQNAAQWQASIAEHDAIMLPAGDARVSLIDARDIAAAAAEVLTAPAPADGIHDLTGPEALSYTELAAWLSRASGRTIRHLDVPPERALRAMLQAGIPEWTARARLELYATYRAGEAAVTATGVSDLTGRAARRFSDFAAELGPRLRR